MYPMVNTAGGCIGLREEETSAISVLKTVVCESDYETQRHSKGSVVQMNLELSLELRFVPLKFPLPFPGRVLLIEYSSSKQRVAFVSLIRDLVTKLRYRL